MRSFKINLLEQNKLYSFFKRFERSLKTNSIFQITFLFKNKQKVC